MCWRIKNVRRFTALEAIGHSFSLIWIGGNALRAVHIKHDMHSEYAQANHCHLALKTGQLIKVLIIYQYPDT
jgi:hypothetical protein